MEQPAFGFALEYPTDIEAATPSLSNSREQIYFEQKVEISHPLEAKQSEISSRK